MAAVVFAFGARPGLPGDDALELARLLEVTRTLAGDSAARKIRAQARRDPDRGETSEDVELEEAELKVLATVLAEEPWPKEQPWFDHLHDEVARVRGEVEIGRPRSAVVTFDFGRERPSELGCNEAEVLVSWLEEQSYRDLGDRIVDAISEAHAGREGHMELSEGERDRMHEVLNAHRDQITERSKLDFLRAGLAAEQIARPRRPPKDEAS